jgi:LmbE family N-acetylglucosaminyl deacetylase
MLGLRFADLGHVPRVLCIGAHCDDIEIGCGGTLMGWAQRYPGMQVTWAVFSGDEQRQRESVAAAVQLGQAGPPYVLRFCNFRDRFFPADGERIKKEFDRLRNELEPDIVLTHHLGDRHQDHELLARYTWNTFRSHLILEYEIPKYEGDLGQPNVFVPLTAEDLERKVQCLLSCFQSQRTRAWFTADTFRGLARLRGIECASSSGFAEAFHGRKLSL